MSYIIRNVHTLLWTPGYSGNELAEANTWWKRCWKQRMQPDDWEIIEVNRALFKDVPEGRKFYFAGETMTKIDQMHGKNRCVNDRVIYSPCSPVWIDN